MHTKQNLRLAIFQTERGIELNYINNSVQHSVLICHCDHRQSAIRIAEQLAKQKNLPVVYF